MKETVLRALLLWLVLFILLQPLFTYIDYLLDLQVKANTSYITQKAAAEGMVTTAMKNEVIGNLAAVGFSRSSIVITSSTETAVERKQRIDVTVTAPRIELFPFRFTAGSSPQRYYGHGSIMSEYLD